jgi:hypothetical protein
VASVAKIQQANIKFEAVESFFCCSIEDISFIAEDLLIVDPEELDILTHDLSAGYHSTPETGHTVTKGTIDGFMRSVTKLIELLPRQELMKKL